MSHAPLFSIIVPAYNTEKYLQKCLASVTRQTFQDWECICVDDGSTDATLEIIRGFARLDNRIKVFHQENRGVSAARNAALAVVKGLWIQFLDSDDSLAYDFLEKLSGKVLEHSEVNAIEHMAVYCYHDGRRTIGTPEGRIPAKGFVNCDDILSDPYGVKYTSLARCVCYKIFKSKIIKENGLRFTEGIPVGEDSLFASEFYACGGSALICPDVIGYIRIFREGSALMTVTSQKLIPQIRAAEIFLNVWRCRRTRGCRIKAASLIAALPWLGKVYGSVVHRECIDALIESTFYNGEGIRFLITHGKWKARLFAIVYCMAPHWLKKKVLLLVSK